MPPELRWSLKTSIGDKTPGAQPRFYFTSIWDISGGSRLTQPWQPASLVSETCNSSFPACLVYSRLARPRNQLSKHILYLELPDIDEALRYADCLAEAETIELNR